MKELFAFGVRDPDVELDEDEDAVAVNEGESPWERDDIRTAMGRDSAGEGI